MEIFKKMTYYKSPITLENGDKWVSSYNDFPDSITESDAIAFLKDIYDNYSPVVETNDFTYKSEGLMRDEWQTVDETVQSKSGDCEDYAILAASRAVFTKNGGTAIPASDLRIVNGLVGYGGPDPKSHTVLLYQDYVSLD